VLTTPWLSMHRQNHCDERIAGCRCVTVEPATLTQALGVNDSVLLLLQANYWHNESNVRLTSHLHVCSFTYLLVKKKVKCSRYRPGVAQRVGRGTALLFHDRGTRRGEWSAARPGRTLPPGKTQHTFYRRLDGPQGRSG